MIKNHGRETVVGLCWLLRANLFAVEVRVAPEGTSGAGEGEHGKGDGDGHVHSNLTDIQITL